MGELKYKFSPHTLEIVADTLRNMGDWHTIESLADSLAESGKTLTVSTLRNVLSDLAAIEKVWYKTVNRKRMWSAVHATASPKQLVEECVKNGITSISKINKLTGLRPTHVAYYINRLDNESK